MILYVKNAKEHTQLKKKREKQNLLELINKYIKFAGIGSMNKNQTLFLVYL